VRQFLPPDIGNLSIYFNYFPSGTGIAFFGSSIIAFNSWTGTEP